MLSKISNTFLLNTEQIRYILILKDHHGLHSAHITWIDGFAEDLLLGSREDADNFIDILDQRNNW